MIRGLALAAVTVLVATACGDDGDDGAGQFTTAPVAPVAQLGSTEVETTFSAAVVADDIVVAASTQGELAGPHAGDRDIAVLRIDDEGSRVWELQLGTDANDSPLGLDVGPDDTIWVAGFTEGDLAAPNAGSADAWVATLEPDGTVRWQTQFGGDQWDRIFDVVAFDGGAYVSGYTLGQIGDEPAPGGGDAFVARLDDQGTVEWIRQLGTDASDWGQGSAVAADGGVVITGYTEGAFGNEPAGRRDAFVAHLDAAGATTWVSQFGGPEDDWTQGVAVAPDGAIVVAGFTSSDLGAPAGGQDGVLAGFTASGEATFTTQIGTAGTDSLFDVHTDGTSITATGSTDGEYQSANSSTRGDRDGVLVRMAADGTDWTAEHVGTAAADDLTGLVVVDGRVVVSGSTFGDLVGTNVGDADVFVALG